MKEILLSRHGKNRGKYVALVDDADYDRLNKLRWHVRITKHTCYATSGSGFDMHRMILGITDSKIEGDHRDHNGLNNQRYNLRISTIFQNRRNKSSANGASSKYLGVCKVKRTGKFICNIWVNGKTKHLGYFEDEIYAAKIYDNAAIKYYGEFANLNFKSGFSPVVIRDSK